MLKKNKFKLIIGFVCLVIVTVGLFTKSYFNSSEHLYTRLNTEEKHATKLAIDWVMFLNHYDKRSINGLYNVDIEEMYYYKDAEDFVISIKYYLDKTENDSMLLEIAVPSDKDTQGLVDTETLSKLSENFLQGFGTMLTLNNELNEKWKSNSFEDGSVYVKIDDGKLEIINKIINNDLSDTEIDTKFERFTNIANNILED